MTLQIDLFDEALQTFLALIPRTVLDLVPTNVCCARLTMFKCLLTLRAFEPPTGVLFQLVRLRRFWLLTVFLNRVLHQLGIFRKILFTNFTLERALLHRFVPAKVAHHQTPLRECFCALGAPEETLLVTFTELGRFGFDPAVLVGRVLRELLVVGNIQSTRFTLERGSCFCDMHAYVANTSVVLLNQLQTHRTLEKLFSVLLYNDRIRAQLLRLFLSKIQRCKAKLRPAQMRSDVLVNQVLLGKRFAARGTFEGAVFLLHGYRRRVASLELPVSFQGHSFIEDLVTLVAPMSLFFLSLFFPVR